ncbi:MAG: FkbM family methyltransferase, partial [Oscillospiraceae bacterium]|nr:FkbM family methyltransferase [Oscillospiraceae bacterium]
CKDTQLPFSSKAGRNSSLTTDGELFPARSVDSLVHNESVSFLKMDVEGFEREALWGAFKTIYHYQPKLCVSIYHRNQDIFELPLLVKMLNPNYKIYIRHKLYIPAWDTNLYALPDEI